MHLTSSESASSRPLNKPRLAPNLDSTAIAGMRFQEKSHFSMNPQSQDSKMQKTLMLGASLVVSAVILIVGVIWLAGSKLIYVDRERPLVYPNPTAKSK